ncbi:transcription initiation factor TFIID subunit A-domain-containing protein [Entophlyctis helioformis]|nr:transcription initiation factor TFIID subunit A-domain-containing protein [Entophlyctis helioformis]
MTRAQAAAQQAATLAAVAASKVASSSLASSSASAPAGSGVSAGESPVPGQLPSGVAMAKTESSGGSSTEFGDQQPMITKDTLRLLMRQVDKEQKLDMDVEDLLLDVANEFVRSVSDSAAKLAKHRGSSSLDVRDVLFELDRTHDIRVPGYGEDLSTEGVRKGKSMLRAHASRVLHVRDTMRKEAIAKRSSTRTKRRT